MFFYKLITFILAPVIFVYHILRIVQKKECWESVKEKFTFKQKVRPEGQVIWLHAASVGEVNIIINIIREFYNNGKYLNFLVTTSTQASAKLFKNKGLKNSCHQFVPIDISFAVHRFLQHWQPSIAIFIESELWPNIIHASADRCKIFLYNARMSNLSYRKWLLFPQFLKKLLNRFTDIVVSSKVDSQYYKKFSAENTKFLGNLKYAAPPLDYDINNLKLLRSVLLGKKIWVAASLHVGEEEKILYVHKELKKNIKNLFTIMIPRHPCRDSKIKELLQKNKCSYISDIKEFDRSTELMLISKIGVLGDYFRLTEIVFMGGSLVNIGGHNIIEPAKLLCIIMMGPYYYNFKEITEDFIKKEAMIIVKDKEQLYEQLSLAFKEIKLKDKLVKNALLAAQKYQNIIRKLVDNISKFI